MEITLQLRCLLVCQFKVSFSTLELHYKWISYNDVFFMTLGLRFFCGYYVIYLFDMVTFFNDVRIMLYFGTFELRMEVTLQLSSFFVRHCDVSLLRRNYSIYLFDVVTFFNDVRIMLYFGTFE